MADTLRLFYSVFKLRIGFAIMLCALAGMAVAPGAAPDAWRVLVLALAVLMSSAAAGAFNQYVERDLDARMQRTRSRPFVTGRFRAGHHWLAAIGLILAVDRILDMFRTATNVWSDSCGAVIIARSEGERLDV